MRIEARAIMGRIPFLNRRLDGKDRVHRIKRNTQQLPIVAPDGGTIVSDGTGRFTAIEGSVATNPHVAIGVPKRI